jgi:hypothetical protein
MSAAAARTAGTEEPWAAIHHPDVPLVVEAGEAPAGPWVEALLARAPFTWRASGPVGAVADLLPEAPAPLRMRIAALAARFAALMGSPLVTVRVEGVTGNACTRMHADFTDVRLILTLAGPGTEHLAGDDLSASIQQLPAGHIGLFKGRTYPGAGPDRHAPCLHRSPPILGTGARRLVLVIDTAGPDG